MWWNLMGKIWSHVKKIGSFERKITVLNGDVQCLIDWEGDIWVKIWRWWSKPCMYFFVLRFYFWGAWVAQWVKPLPSAQVMIPGSWNGAPHPHLALCSAGNLLPPPPLPASLPTCDLSFSLSNLRWLLILIIKKHMYYCVTDINFNISF